MAPSRHNYSTLPGFLRFSVSVPSRHGRQGRAVIAMIPLPGERTAAEVRALLIANGYPETITVRVFRGGEFETAAPQ